MNTPAGQFAFTSNTKLAATLRVFEIPLPSHNPATVAEVYKLSDLRRGWKDPKPPIRTFWTFLPHPSAAAVIKAYQSTTAEGEFEAFIQSLELLPAKLAELRAFYSASVAQVCRQSLDMNEWLNRQVDKCPDHAKWQAIINDDGSVYTMFPKAASAETKAKFFAKS